MLQRNVLTASVMCFVVAVGGCIGLVRAADVPLKIENPVVRLLPPTVKNTAAYFSVINTSEDDVYLVGGESDLVERVELHNHVMDGEVMRMEKQASVLIPAGEMVVFQPGGLHVMLFGLKQTLRADQQVSITLETQNGQAIPIVARVGEPTQSSGHHHHH